MKKKTLSLLVTVFIFISAMIPTHISSASEEKQSLIRVRLSLGEPKALEIAVTGIYVCPESNTSFADGTLTLTAKGGQLTAVHSVQGAIYTGTKLQLERLDWNVDSGNLRFAVKSGVRSYLGNFLFTAENGILSCINTVPMTQYLYGVVGHEMSNSFPLEALKAQAVAAKCYGLRSIGSHTDYDIGDTASDQVYRGYTPENANVIAACNAVNSCSLYYNGQIMSCYYAASNGGYTKIPSTVWEGRAQFDGAYAVTEDPFDMMNPSSPRELLCFPSGFYGKAVDQDLYFYIRKLVSDLIEKEKLTPGGYQFYRIVSVDDLISYDDKKRTEGIEHTGADLLLTIAFIKKNRPTAVPLVQNISEEDILSENTAVPPEAASSMEIIENTTAVIHNDTASMKDVFRTKQIKIPLFFNELVKKGLLKDTYRVTYAVKTNGGFALQNCRYGHGVGMSQRGAQQMAKLGYTYQDILRFYYPGAVLKTAAVASPVGNALSVSENLPHITADPQKTATGYVYNSTVHLRKSPSTSSDSLGTLSVNTNLILTGLFGDWYQVYDYTHSRNGYCHKAYIRENSDSIIASGFINASSVNMRSGAGTKYEAVTKLSENTEVGIYGISGDWYHIYIPDTGMTGYVMNDYITVINHSLSPYGSGGILTITSTPAPASVSQPVPVLSGTDATIHLPASIWNDPSGIPASLSDDSFVYDSPSLDAAVINRLPSGKTVSIMEKTGFFYRISYDTYEGYIPVRYAVSNYDPDGEKLPAAIVAKEKITLRRGPSTEAEAVSSVFLNKKVSVLSMEGEWYYVEDMETCLKGYVFHRYIDLILSQKIIENGILIRDFGLFYEPNMDENVSVFLSKGTQIHVIGTMNGWSFIRMDEDILGFLPSHLIRED